MTNLKIETSLINSISKSLKGGKSVNRRLPAKGKIVIDHILPFICLYRYGKNADPLFLKLIKTQAAYIIVNDQLDINRLIKSISSTLSDKLNAFMIIELWPDMDINSHTFKVYGPADRAPATVNALKKGLNDIKNIYSSVSAQILDSKTRHPTHLPPVLNIDETKESGSLVLGISIPPIYIDPETKNTYPILFYKLEARISRAVKKAVYEFIRVQTSNKFSHYLMLGKARLNKTIINADATLAAISEKMNFLMRITPVNGQSEWMTFKKNNYQKPPSFKYRLIDLDPELEKRKLFKIPMEKIRDPTLSFILRDKRLELEKQLTMLEERETDNFMYTGMSLYGVPDKYTLKAANVILNKLESDHTETNASVDARGFAKEAQKEIDVYQKHFPKIHLKLQIRKDVDSIMVSKANLLINDKRRFNKKRVMALIHHEVGTHILTYCNGHKQPFKQMYTGLAGYDKLQEGLAVLAEYLVGGLTNDRLRLLAARVIAVECMIRHADFIEVFKILTQNYGFEEEIAFNITTRVFRGGGFTKDALYLKGLLELLRYLRKGGNIEILYTGKFDLEHVDFIEELMHRKIIKNPMVPTFFQNPLAKERLKKVQSNTSLNELLN